MLFMILEKFHSGKVKQLYKRFEEKGRQLPGGVNYINNWISEDVTTCYQVMESNTEVEIKEWITFWNDMADFALIPVINSAQALQKVNSLSE